MATSKHEMKQLRFKQTFKELSMKINDKTLTKGNKVYLLASTRKQLRQNARDKVSPIGKIGASQFAGLDTRRERRIAEGKDFKPQFNGEVIRVQHKDVLKHQINEEKRKNKKKSS